MLTSIGATTVETRETGPQFLDWGNNNVLVPQLLGRCFQKSRNFTTSSHQNAGFSMSFQKFSGDDTPEPSQLEKATRSAPRASVSVSSDFMALYKCCEPWSPSTFQPWLHPCSQDMSYIHVYTETC